MRTIVTPKEQYKDWVAVKCTCSTDQCVLCDYINIWHTLSIAGVPVPLTTNSLELWGFAPTKKYCINDYLFYSIILLQICGFCLFRDSYWILVSVNIKINKTASWFSRRSQPRGETRVEVINSTHLWDDSTCRSSDQAEVPGARLSHVTGKADSPFHPSLCPATRTQLSTSQKVSIYLLNKHRVEWPFWVCGSHKVPW